ncbi:YtnP family quorum-quenching lactonase [Metabacillus iocasae]|uniref:Glyoxylase-like metal-dependent hydrolase (Beta-lactamase superfamily II) n=1 Tax=Priestia iocasae TaxID=2291674 RepID=A0ABS2QZG7_9BACI|nr:MBL fold metallo-hydrolase [Metabacillus iocasae]MBM7704875.1 glyoxylase-like metal-dependent hydrolase (beta-lactamase superfamily II) [Metabacillus iocasae]
MEALMIGKITLTWLQGGENNLDGGAMFGVVPKALWSKKYDVNEKNQIRLRADPILIQTGGKNILIESGLGKGKLTEKQKRNFGVNEESSVDESLNKLGLTSLDIDIILMTHMHFDHASGLTTIEGGRVVSAFKNAKIIVTDVEWEEMRNPNIRSKNTYWKENWEAIAKQVVPFTGEIQVVDGVKMYHTGGHSDGHAVVVIESDGETLVHMGDLLPTHAHQNVLWVMAYDDYPMTSIEQKQTWLSFAMKQGAWLSFYHDAIYRALKWNHSGEITEQLTIKK